SRIPKDESLKYAYATYGGLIMEVYEIQCWLKAGSLQYFTRDLTINSDTNRSEFVGRIAAKEIRDKYVGKLIKKPRSHGNPFVKVGGCLKFLIKRGAPPFCYKYNVRHLLVAP
ncbi:hypothetical protein BN1044_01665, partial [Hafnia alvei]